MTNKIDDSAAKILDKLSDGAEAVIGKLGSMADKYGPEVIDSALWVVRVGGLQELGHAVFLLVVGLALAIVCGKTYRVGRKAGDVWDGSEFPLRLIIGALGSSAGGFILFAGVDRLFNVWTWVAIFEPKLWVAKRLLGL